MTAPEIKRVWKVCRNPNSIDPKGCHTRYEGWAFASTFTGSKYRTEPTGEVWGLCDACIDRWEALKKAAAKPETDEGKEIEIAAPRKVFGYDD